MEDNIIYSLALLSKLSVYRLTPRMSLVFLLQQSRLENSPEPSTSQPAFTAYSSSTLSLLNYTIMVAILNGKSVRLMRKGYKFCNLFITGPYRWGNTERAPQSISGLRHRMLWFVNVLLVAIQATFTTAQLWRIRQTGVSVYRIYMLFSASVYIYGVLFQVANVRTVFRLPKFVKSYILFFEGLKSKEHNFYVFVI